MKKELVPTKTRVLAEPDRRPAPPPTFDPDEVASVIHDQFDYLSDLGFSRAMKGAWAALQRTATVLSLQLPEEAREGFLRSCGIRPINKFDEHSVRERVIRERLSSNQALMLAEFARRDVDGQGFTTPTSPLLPLVSRGFQWSLTTLQALEDRGLIEAHPDSGNRQHWRVTTLWRITDLGRKKAARDTRVRARR